MLKFLFWYKIFILIALWQCLPLSVTVSAVREQNNGAGSEIESESGSESEVDDLEAELLPMANKDLKGSASIGHGAYTSYPYYRPIAYPYPYYGGLGGSYLGGYSGFGGYGLGYPYYGGYYQGLGHYPYGHYI